MKRILSFFLLLSFVVFVFAKDAITIEVETLPSKKVSTNTWVCVRSVSTVPVTNYKEIIFGSSRPNDNSTVKVSTGWTFTLLQKYLKKLVDEVLDSNPENPITYSYITDDGFKLIESSYSPSTKRWTVKLYVNDKYPDTLTKEQISNLLTILQNIL